MAAELVSYLVRLLVDRPEAVRVEQVDEEDGALRLRVFVAEDDRGKVIGRGGRVVQALRILARAAGARERRRVLVDIVD